MVKLTCLLILDRDTICDMGGAAELANYGEYSGAPSEQQTYDYAKTLLSLMCKQKHPQGVYCSRNVGGSNEWPALLK